MSTSSSPLADAGYALGPLDGRYRAAVAPLVEHLSEAALNRERLRVEVEWLVHLTARGAVPGRARPHRARRPRSCGPSSTGSAPQTVAEMAEIERETVHDVKAVEVVAAPPPGGTTSAADWPSWCTSASPARTSTTSPTPSWCAARCARCGCPPRGPCTPSWWSWRTRPPTPPMLARTHGQPATPTTLGKELAVTRARGSTASSARVEGAEALGKLNGATGTYAAHVVAVPDDGLAGRLAARSSRAWGWSGTR